jgi:homoserine O-succinyltransferase
MPTFRIAILDLYNNSPNEGMRCIRQLLRRAEADNQVIFTVDTFNVRAENQVPSLDYDIYISSGGPGSPLPSDEPWESLYFQFIDSLLAYNTTAERKKHLLLICHSFQLMLPVHLTDAGEADPVLAQLPEPFYAVDSRDYQLTEIDNERLEVLGAQILCLEKERPYVPLARAIMAIRFTPEVLGTQFHPEADGEGMLRYMLTDERKQQVITAYGEDKYDEMVRLLSDPETIERTEAIIVPTFLRRAMAQLGQLELA